MAPRMRPTRHTTKTDTERLKAALKWLAQARQASVDVETSAAYALGLRDLPIASVELACRDIGYQPVADYQTRWPELGILRARVEAIERVARERAESRKLLLREPVDRISPEKWEDIKRRLRIAIGRTDPDERRSQDARLENPFDRDPGEDDQ